MPFTIVLFILALLGLGIVFGVAYKVRGFKIALIASGIALVVFGILYIVSIYVITGAM